MLRRTLLGLTVVTGVVDAVSFLGLGHVFTANMTGNVVFLGFALGGARDMASGRSGKMAVPDLTTTVLTLTITGLAADSRLGGGLDGRVGPRLFTSLILVDGKLPYKSNG
jgi:uncharacterized membrane protein YoaK (UPF0700 family)